MRVSPLSGWKMGKERELVMKKRENLKGWLFLSVWVIGFVVFTLIPIVRTLWMSFERVTITGRGMRTRFVGLENYKNAFFSDVEFVDVLIQYVGEILLYVPIVIVFSLVIAMILNRKIRGKGIWRTLFFLPVIIISGPVMKELMDQGVMAIQGLDGIAAVAVVLKALPGPLSRLFDTLIHSFVMVLWFSGVQILMFLSALQKMDRPMYEAANIDGASGWEMFWKITLPNLRTMIIINIVYTIVSISTFTLNGVIGLIQKHSFSAQTGLGYAASLTWIYFIVLLLVMGFFMVIYGPKKEQLYGRQRKKG